MRRMSSTVAVLALVLIATAAVGSATLAQDAGTAALAGHPLVGAWLIDTSAEDPTNPLSKAIFTADGTYIQADVDGVGVGSWEATGPRTGALTILFQQPDENEAITTTTVRATVEVGDDGQSLSASFTLEFVGPDGTSSGQLGPATATGTRIAVEPMGTPVGPLVPPPSPSPSAGG